VTYHIVHEFFQHILIAHDKVFSLIPICYVG